LRPKGGVIIFPEPFLLLERVVGSGFQGGLFEEREQFTRPSTEWHVRFNGIRAGRKRTVIIVIVENGRADLSQVVLASRRVARFSDFGYRGESYAN
jgi:hypothetical protein